jgi:hypothetical protein
VAVATRFLFAALFTEYEAPEFVAKMLCFFRILSGSKTLCQLKETGLLLLLRFDALFDQFDKDAVIAEAATLSKGIDLLGHLSRQSDAAPDSFCGGHGTIIHR